MKILTVVGVRPQFVKAAVLSREFAKHQDIEEVIVDTGQHFDANMSNVFFDEMSIPCPKYNLDINGLNHGAMTGKMLEGIEALILREKPDLLLVYGDTNSTLSGALAARKLHVKVAHVEAGLRSFNMQMPEEVNRILTDRISDILFCPTDSSVQNLKNEGYQNFDVAIVKSGDVMQDAAMFCSKHAEEHATVDENISDKGFILCTLHRAENTDHEDRLREIVSTLNKIHSETPVVLPLHPRTRSLLDKFGIDLKVNTIEPVGYFDMITLLKNCELVLTDSGGLQKEAFFFGKNCVTIRDQTEWIELIEGGFNILASAEEKDIISKVEEMKQRKNDFNVNLYGNGKAAEVIVGEIKRYFSEGK